METTIAALFDRLAENHRQAAAIIDIPGGAAYTYGELKKQAEIMAKGLLALDLRSGAHMAVMAPNCPEWIMLQLAAAKTGLVLTNLDPGSTAEQMQYLLDNSDCEALFLDPQYIDRFTALEGSGLTRLKHAVLMGAGRTGDFVSLPQFIEGGEPVSQAELKSRQNRVSPHDVACLMYTSGTTGAPKGVMTTHYGLLSTSLASARNQSLGPGSLLCLSVPLSHMFGCICVALTGLGCGAGLVLPDRTPSPASCLDAVASHGCAAIYGAPTFFIAMLEEQKAKPRKLASLRTGIMAGAPCPLEVMKRVVSELGLKNILVGYGQTEASSWAAQTLPSDPLELRVSTVGRAIPGVEIKIADPSSGKALPSGQVGEICCRGFNMKGYYKKPAATASTLDSQGWLHSGDLGTQDEDGYVRISGRLKEVIRKGGKVIIPTAIENLLYEYPDLVNVQVFGLPHAQLGEVVAAWVILSENAKGTPDEVLKWCRQNLEPDQIPDHLKVVERFPMTSLGKVQKYRLREMYAAELGISEG